MRKLTAIHLEGALSVSPAEIVRMLRRQARAIDGCAPVMQWTTDASGRPGLFWVMPAPLCPPEPDGPCDHG